MLKKNLAPTPPMGWNSYDYYGVTINEGEVRANAACMATQLVPFGWQYLVIDAEWAEPEPIHAIHTEPTGRLAMDSYGRLLPAPERFPSAADGAGFKPLADLLHAQGLKFGIHIMRGIPVQAVEANTPILGTPFHARDIADATRRCAWCPDMVGVNTAHPAGQAYFDSLVALYAAWGVDFIKADDMISPYHMGEVEALARAVATCERDIVLSLSPGNTKASINRTALANAAHLQTHSHLWRISDDFWDRWPDLKAQFEVCANWIEYSGPGAWADADMLPFGRIGARVLGGADRQTRLTPDEQYTLMSLWAMCRSPLMMGGDLPSLDPFTLGLLTNERVLAINQRSIHNRVVCWEAEQVMWAAEHPDQQAHYVAIFNLSDTEQLALPIPFADLDIRFPCNVQEVWGGDQVSVSAPPARRRIPAHGSLLLRFVPSWKA